MNNRYGISCLAKVELCAPDREFGCALSDKAVDGLAALSVLESKLRAYGLHRITIERSSDNHECILPFNPLSAAT
jgi:hypothetical protein